MASVVSAGSPKKGLLFFSTKYFWRNGKSLGHMGHASREKTGRTRRRNFQGQVCKAGLDPTRAAVIYSTQVI